MSKCNKKISKEEAAYLERLAEITIEAALGGKYSFSYRILSEFCRYVMLDEFEGRFGTQKFEKLSAAKYKEALAFLEDWFPSDKIMEESVVYEDAFSRYIYQFCDEPNKESKAYQQLMEDFMYAICSDSKGSCED